MIYQLKDMEDLNNFKTNNFRSNPEIFNLNECLSEIKQTMEIKCNLKNLNFIMNENNLIKSMNQYKEKNYDLENSIPLKVIGDQERLKQVAYNIIVNAINKTYFGSVTVSVSYNFVQSLLKI